MERARRVLRRVFAGAVEPWACVSDALALDMRFRISRMWPEYQIAVGSAPAAAPSRSNPSVINGLIRCHGLDWSDWRTNTPVRRPYPIEQRFNIQESL